MFLRLTAAIPLSPEANKQLASSLRMSALRGLPSSFKEMFECVFGKDHLSRQCLTRSALSSLAAFILLTIVLATRSWDGSFTRYEGEQVLMAVIAFFTINIAIDYLSLWETRAVIKRLAQTSSPARFILLVFFDLFMSAAVFLILATPLAFFLDRALSDLFGFSSTGKPYDILNSIRFIQDFWLLDSWEANTVVNFYTTFVTSAWLWIHVASTLIAKGLRSRAIHAPINFLDWDNRPLQSLGVVGAFLLTCCAISAFLFSNIR